MAGRRLKILKKVLWIWGVAAFFGSIFSWILASSASSDNVILALDVVSKVVPSNSQLLRVFFKNSLASLVTIFFGLLLCYFELRVYVGVTPSTYAFLESLTDPLYRVLEALSPIFHELKPFFRSCFLYLYSIPYLTITVNGLAFGFLLGHFILKDMFNAFISMIMPHALLEVPAMLLSACLGLLIADSLKSSIVNADLEDLKKRIKETMKGEILTLALAIQIMLLAAAILEIY